MISKNGYKVLFLSANAGTGHNMAAVAMQKSLEMIEPGVSCEIVNSYKFLNSLLEKLIQDGYLHLIRLLPTIYGYFYERKNKKMGIRGLKDWLNKLTANNMKKLIDQMNPDLIVCTHAFPCGVISEIKRKHGLAQKVMGVITDFVVSPFWLYPETDLYLIAADDLREGMVERGIDPNRIVTTGIPIDPNFNAHLDKKEIRRKLGMDESLPLILVMGGGLGMRPVPGILRTLKKIQSPFQAGVFLGKNEKLRKKLDDALVKLKMNNGRIKVRTIGFVDNVFEYMKAADVLVTKPGGMTVAEAVSVGLPMIITCPIPGQETRNTRYLVEKGIGVRVHREKDLTEEIEKLLNNPSEREKMSRISTGIASPQASTVAAKKIHEMLMRTSG